MPAVAFLWVPSAAAVVGFAFDDGAIAVQARGFSEDFRTLPAHVVPEVHLLSGASSSILLSRSRSKRSLAAGRSCAVAGEEF